MLAKIKKNYFLLICTFLILYFFFNLLDGERGLISYFKKKNLLENLKTEEIQLNKWNFCVSVFPKYLRNIIHDKTAETIKKKQVKIWEYL